MLYFRLMLLTIIEVWIRLGRKRKPLSDMLLK